MYMKKLIFVFALFLISCSDYERENFRMEAGKKYELKKWPDSAYIDTLDKFFENEYVKPARKQKAEITMTPRLQQETKKSATSKSQPPNIKQAQPKQETSKPFAESFFYALNKLSENPNNKEFGRRYKAKGGESLDDLLLKVYGSEAKKIPKFVSESMIKQLNPGIDVSSFAEGDMILLPSVSR